MNARQYTKIILSTSVLFVLVLFGSLMIPLIASFFISHKIFSVGS